MRRFTSLILALVILFSPSVSFATENVSQKKTEVSEPQEIRNQNIFVPTSHGVDRATYEEAILVAELEKKSTNELAKTFLIGDYATGEILEFNDIDEVVAMASTSKLVSVYVVLDQIKAGKLKLDDVVTIPHEAEVLPGSSYKIKEGDTKTVKELLTAALVISGNDAITSLAIKVAGSTQAFVDMMNKKCKDLGLTNAHMINPTGLTDYSIEDYNKMTTREMFLLARYIMKEHPEILEYTKMPSIVEADREFTAYSTNPILGVIPEVQGLKTGYTGAAGRCLIATELKPGDGKTTKDLRLITITTGSKSDWSRYVVSKRVANIALTKYENRILGNTTSPVTTIEAENSQEPNYNVYQESEIASLVHPESKVESEVHLNEIAAPLPKDTVVGSITYKVDGKEVGESKLIIKEDIRERGIINKIMSIYREIFKNIDKDAA